MYRLLQACEVRAPKGNLLGRQALGNHRRVGISARVCFRKVWSML
jgi:hypothetical protein